MSSFEYNIVLIPSSELADTATLLSNQLEKHDSLFTLGDGSFYPHLSLYMTQLDEHSLDTISNVLQSIAAQVQPINLIADDFNDFKQSRGYISISYHRTAEIDKLQEAVVHAINPHRNGLRLNAMKHLETAEGIERANLQQYGYGSIGELFNPHITFTRLKSSEHQISTYLQNSAQFDGNFTKLGLFELGENGTCIRKIAEFELGKQ